MIKDDKLYAILGYIITLREKLNDIKRIIESIMIDDQIDNKKDDT